jgi:hypothetical protein
MLRPFWFAFRVKMTAQMLRRHVPYMTLGVLSNAIDCPAPHARRETFFCHAPNLALIASSKRRALVNVGIGEVGAQFRFDLQIAVSRALHAVFVRGAHFVFTFR